MYQDKRLSPNGFVDKFLVSRGDGLTRTNVLAHIIDTENATN